MCADFVAVEIYPAGTIYSTVSDLSFEDTHQ